MKGEDLISCDAITQTSRQYCLEFIIVHFIKVENYGGFCVLFIVWPIPNTPPPPPTPVQPSSHPHAPLNPLSSANLGFLLGMLWFVLPVRGYTQGFQLYM